MNACAMITACRTHQKDDNIPPIPAEFYRPSEPSPDHQVYLPPSDEGRADRIPLGCEDVWTQ